MARGGIFFLNAVDAFFFQKGMDVEK